MADTVTDHDRDTYTYDAMPYLRRLFDTDTNISSRAQGLRLLINLALHR